MQGLAHGCLTAGFAMVDIRTGVPNLWAISIFKKAPDEQLTHFTSG